MYDQARALCESIRRMRPVAVQIQAIVVSYSPEVTKVRVDFLRLGSPALSIEYWGNAEVSWVKANIKMNATAVKG